MGMNDLNRMANLPDGTIEIVSRTYSELYEKEGS